MIAKIALILILNIPFRKKKKIHQQRPFKASVPNKSMPLLHFLGAVFAGYRTYRRTRRTIRESWRVLRDLTEVLDAFVSGNLSSDNTDWLWGLLTQNLRRLWDIIGPRYFRQLHSWHTIYRLVRDFLHSIRDFYYVSNGWLGGNLTYGDRDRMRSLQIQNWRRLRDLLGSRRTFCLRTVQAYS